MKTPTGPVEPMLLDEPQHVRNPCVRVLLVFSRNEIHFVDISPHFSEQDWMQLGRRSTLLSQSLCHCRYAMIYTIPLPALSVSA